MINKFYFLFGALLTQITIAQKLLTVQECTKFAVIQNVSLFFITPKGTCIMTQTRLSRQNNAASSCSPLISTFTSKTVLTETYNWTSLLFRTRAESKVHPYKIFLNGPTNETQMRVEDLVGTLKWYKNPDFYSVGQNGLKIVTLEMLLVDGSSAIRLEFDFTGGNFHEDGTWFLRRNLRSSYPWDIDKMKTDNFNFFSLPGKDQRFFFINIRYGGCYSDRGYLAITTGTACIWEKSNRHHPSYIWNSNPKLKSWHLGRNDAVELRITGQFFVEKGSRLFQCLC